MASQTQPAVYDASVSASDGHSDMSAEYKRHKWLVYTAPTTKATVGWPMAVAEAQASGTGVCMQNIRPDVAEYVGPAGFMFDTIDELTDILRGPLPDKMRSAGFEHARRSDIREHLPILEDLWAGR